MLAVCMQGEGESLFFFLRLAAQCMVLLRQFKILLGRWIGGSQVVYARKFSPQKWWVEEGSWREISHRRNFWTKFCTIIVMKRRFVKAFLLLARERFVFKAKKWGRKLENWWISQAQRHISVIIWQTNWILRRFCALACRPTLYEIWCAYHQLRGFTEWHFELCCLRLKNKGP